MKIEVKKTVGEAPGVSFLNSTNVQYRRKNQNLKPGTKAK